MSRPAAAALAVTLLAVTLLALAPPAEGARAAPAGTAAIEARMRENLAAGNVAAAAREADSLLAARRARFREKPLAEASFLDTLGLRFLSAGTPPAWQAARAYLSRALAVREKIVGRDDLDVAGTLSMLAASYDFEGRWNEALPFEQRSLAIRTRNLGGSHPAVAASRRQIGLFLFQLGRYAEAEPMLARALAIYDSLPPARYAQRVVDGLNNLGEVSRVQDKFEQAASYFERGLDVARARLPAGDPWAGAVRNNLAGLYKDLGRYGEAEPLLVAYLEELKASPSPDREILATAHLNLAEVYRLQDRLDEAAPLYEQALAIAREALPAESPELVPFVNQAAVVYRALGRPERAEPLYRETLGRAERALGLDHPLVAQSLNDLGALLVEKGSLSEAADTLGRALAIRERMLGERHPDAAVTRVELARCLARDPSRGDAAATPLLERAIAVLDSAPAYPDARLDAHALRADIESRGGRADAALADLGEALALVDTLRASHGGGDESRGSFMARHLELYHRMVGWRLARGDLAGALEAHERARARILLDQLGAGSVNLRAGIPAEVLGPLERSEREARQRLARTQRELGDARMRGDPAGRAALEALAALEAARDSAAWDLQRVQETIKERSPVWREVLSAGGRPVSLGEIQRDLLEPGEVMLLYHVGGDGSYLFVIPGGGGAPSFHALALDSVSARELRAAPGPLSAGTLERIMVGEPGRPAAGSAAPLAALLAMRGEEERTLVSQRVAGAPGLLERRLHALARALLPPGAWRAAQSARGAVVVPDGALQLLPFEALVLAMGGGRQATRYWLDQGPPVRYASSATSLLALARRTAEAPGAARPRVMSVCDPDYAPPGSVAAAAPSAARWTALPGTARESEAIRRAFAPESVMVWRGIEATEAHVRAALPGRRYLHFATHGFVTERQSDVLAGLALTPPDSAQVRSDDDGYLQLYEIYELPLACELAVLSACGTQRGRRVAGEGVFALSRGFLTAGARRVVASLWEVNDASTADLIGGFFAGLAGAARSGREPRYPDLLRDAKRRLRSDPRWSDPFYWAPFVLTGVR